MKSAVNLRFDFNVNLKIPFVCEPLRTKGLFCLFCKIKQRNLSRQEQAIGHQALKDAVLGALPSAMKIYDFFGELNFCTFNPKITHYARR